MHYLILSFNSWNFVMFVIISKDRNTFHWRVTDELRNKFVSFFSFGARGAIFKNQEKYLVLNIFLTYFAGAAIEMLILLKSFCGVNPIMLLLILLLDWQIRRRCNVWEQWLTWLVLTISLTICDPGWRECSRDIRSDCVSLPVTTSPPLQPSSARDGKTW